MEQLIVNFTNDLANLFVKYNTVTNVDTVLAFAKQILGVIITALGSIQVQ